MCSPWISSARQPGETHRGPWESPVCQGLHAPCSWAAGGQSPLLRAPPRSAWASERPKESPPKECVPAPRLLGRGGRPPGQQRDGPTWGREASVLSASPSSKPRAQSGWSQSQGSTCCCLCRCSPQSSVPGSVPASTHSRRRENYPRHLGEPSPTSSEAAAEAPEKLTRLAACSRVAPPWDVTRALL